MGPEKILLTDVDGTIVDFGKPFHEWMEQEGYTAIGSLSETFDIDIVFGIDRKTAVDCVERFCKSPVFAQLEPILGAVEAIAWAKAEGWRVIAITSCAASPEAQEMRCRNLEELFHIPACDVVFAGLLGDKASILQGYPSAIWVDDHPHHIDEGTLAGHKCFIIDKPYNRKYCINDGQSTVRVNDWNEILLHIK